MDCDYDSMLQEFFADYVAIDPYHFTLNTPANHMYMLPAVIDPPNLQSYCDRIVDGLAALFLSFKRRPVIRYSRTSDIAKRIAHEASVSSFTYSNQDAFLHCRSVVI